MLPSNRFDLNLLKVFDAIYTRGGVSEAARHLNLSQPAISHSLAKMREAFGDKLFVRHGNGLVPTAMAHAIIQPIRDALRSVDVALLNANAFDPSVSMRSFTLGLRPSGEVTIFAGLIARLLAEARGITVASSYFARGALDRSLAKGDLDLAIDIRRPPVAGIRAIPVEPASLVVVARANHSSLGQNMDLKSYLELDHVFVSPRASGLGLEDVALAKLGLRRSIKVRCQHAFTAWQIVETSDLICTLPRSFADALGAIGHHRLFPLPFQIAPNELHLYWHTSSEADQGAAWLRNIVLSHFSAGST